MYEVEVKVEAAHGPVGERLAELGADSLGVVHQLDTYYEHPVRSFVDADEALRLRRESRSGGGEPNASDDESIAPEDEPSASSDDEPSASDDPEPTATLTYKGPLVDDVSKTREEVETGIADPDATDAILRSVGFEPAADVEKERERFACEGYTVSLDRVTSLGEFVEIEAEGDEPEVAALREGAFDLCRRLGLDPDETIRASYLSLLLAG